MDAAIGIAEEEDVGEVVPSNETKNEIFYAGPETVMGVSDAHEDRVAGMDAVGRKSIGI